MNTLIYFLVDGEWKNISAIFLQVIFSNWKIMELLSILSRMCIYCGDMRFDQNKNVVLMRMMEVKSRRKSHLLIWSIASMIVLIHFLLQSLRILQGSLILFCLYVVQAPHSLTTTKRWWSKMCTDCLNRYRFCHETLFAPYAMACVSYHLQFLPVEMMGNHNMAKELYTKAYNRALKFYSYQTNWNVYTTWSQSQTPTYLDVSRLFLSFSLTDLTIMKNGSLKVTKQSTPFTALDCIGKSNSFYLVFPSFAEIDSNHPKDMCPHYYFASKECHVAVFSNYYKEQVNKVFVKYLNATQKRWPIKTISGCLISWHIRPYNYLLSFFAMRWNTSWHISVVNGWKECKNMSWWNGRILLTLLVVFL